MSCCCFCLHRDTLHVLLLRLVLSVRRQSRLLKFDPQGYQLYTVDHGDAGRLRLDLAHSWDSSEAPSPLLPGHDLIADPNAGWLCSQLECGLDSSSGGSSSNGTGGSDGSKAVVWLPAGPNCLLAAQDDLLVEYDMQMRAPLGLVAFLEGGCDEQNIGCLHATHLGQGRGGVLCLIICILLTEHGTA